MIHNTTRVILPTILVGIFITENTHPSILESFVVNRQRNHEIMFKNANIKTFFVLGHSHEKHRFSKSRFVYMLKMHENMNEGKTYYWFKKAVQIFKNQNIPYHHLNGIIKMDTDCVANWTYFDEQIINSLPQNYYIGKVIHNEECGSYSYCPPLSCNNFFPKWCWVYMQGGFYGLSLNVAQHLMHCRFANSHKAGHEDLLVGTWINHCFKSNVHLKSIEPGRLYCHSKVLTPDHIKNQDFSAICQQK